MHSGRWVHDVTDERRRMGRRGGGLTTLCRVVPEERASVQLQMLVEDVPPHRLDHGSGGTNLRDGCLVPR